MNASTLIGLLMFVATTGAHASTAISRTAACQAALASSDGRFEFGQITHSGVTGEDFFASPVTPTGRPRLVMMVGVPGAGKSTWAARAEVLEWTRLSVDQLRAEVAAGVRDATSLFNPEILDRTRDLLWSKFTRAIEAGESIILDQNNLTPYRLRFARLARRHGYAIEALVFSSADVEVNVDNVQWRVDHPVSGLGPAAIRSRARQFEFFNAELRLGVPVDVPPPEIEPLLRLADEYPSLAAARPQIDADLRAQVDADQFDRVEFAWTPSIKDLPHDSPVLRQRPRLYAALTNKCNRACPWCCVYSNPSKNTFLTPDQLDRHFPADEPFDLQLEGGEPTIHPRLFDFVAHFRARPNAGDLILVTNAVKIPRELDEVKAWLARFGEPFTIKVSINHYLLERDKNLLAKAELLRRAVGELGGQRRLILNVRLRKGEAYGHDEWVRDAVREAGLTDLTNIFYLQSYGLASGEGEWEPPFTVNDKFVLINPDGTARRGSLVDRANEMGALE